MNRRVKFIIGAIIVGLAMLVFAQTYPIATSSSIGAINNTFENDALTTTTTVKATTGNVYGYGVTNTNTTICYIQIFNTTAPTLGTTEPLISLGIPANSSGPAAGVFVFPIPINFSTAIAVAATTASKGASTCATGMTVNVFYQ
jgi:hypothetical protein